MQNVEIPPGLDRVLDEAWKAASQVPGFLAEAEARFLGMAAACAPRPGTIVEIGSFKGKSTVMLARVAQHYGLGRVVAIDPHNFNNVELHEHRTSPEASSLEEFKRNIAAAGVEDFVELRRAYSTDVAPGWSEPIRFLWIDGDHSYKGAKSDFDGFFPHVIPQGIVAFHDALHEFEGPIRVFVEDVLRSDKFGAAGFVSSIAWSQFRPHDGTRFKQQRAAVERVAAPLVPFFKQDQAPTGIKKLRFKLRRSRVPRGGMQPKAWANRLNTPQER